ncbi:metallophosphoesterase family protein [Ralstonia solanacearum]|uniref:metallophosphoesterase family protein n=1 Tax=Ralstonia solanacearum TaxID=305 RepID=UPI00031D9347|nr:metallophosphoesterase [Ralstonia solanacearum]MDC6175963.1 metallophosphoesterase [Ralstonia solanacearum]MDC6208777.1 metallophosphoesterase [Ralstonia solanacearum]MDC6239497.1 metallophosphoesterase [Ralstonia solanacearum]MDD7799378.1 metallophosphoesterase [Ralstonia solanacearum]
MGNHEEIVLCHISDLHFSSGTDQSNPNHSHSVDLLLGLQNRILNFKSIDCLLVSGDISNQGDRQSLVTASGYLFKTIPIGNGEYAGLSFPAEKVRVVPGNHDAWNAADNGTLIDRRQKSLTNYNYAFPHHKIMENGCYFDWLQNENSGIYLAFLDSCFFGDTEQNDESTFGTLRIDQAVAKGKLTVSQTEQLLEWYDQGMQGHLEDPRNSGNYIDRKHFAGSLKILVMHHYLFEPPNTRSDYFMRLQHRDLVFRNIALSDFDALLCGHKHIPSFDVYPYGDYFDDRAVNRYMTNYFRRLIGLESLPIQFTDDSGRMISKALTWLAEFVGSYFKSNQSQIDSNQLAEMVFELLRDGLIDPRNLDMKVRKFIHKNGSSGASLLESIEVKAIQKRISVGFNPQQRKDLKRIADGVSEIAKDLMNRPFLQIMSGSSAKNFSESDKKRSFNLYRIRFQSEKWEIVSEQYCWENGAFSIEPITSTHVFNRKL